MKEFCRARRISYSALLAFVEPKQTIMTENKLCFGDVFISVEMKTEKQLFIPAFELRENMSEIFQNMSDLF